MSQPPTPPCTRCGAPLREGARFCTTCGATIAPSVAPPAPPGPRDPFARTAAPRPSPPRQPSPAAAPGARKNLKPWLIAGAGLATVAVAVLVFRSPGGDGDDGTVQPGGTRPAGTATTGAGLSRTEAAALLSQFSKRAQSATYRVVYDEQGKDTLTGDTFKLTATFAVEPPKRSARLEGDLGSAEGMAMLIDDGKDFYQCGQGAGSDGACEVLTGATSNARRLGFEDLLFDLAADPALGLEETDKREIAGRSARCFKVTGYDGEGTLCVDADLGVVLSADGRFQDTSLKLAATALALKPTAADFKVPFPLPEVTQ